MIAPSGVYSDQSKITGPLAEAYARRVGADFILLAGDASPGWQMGNKYRFTEVARRYELSVLVDCDVVIRPNAPNIFERVPRQLSQFLANADVEVVTILLPLLRRTQH